MSDPEARVLVGALPWHTGEGDVARMFGQFAEEELLRRHVAPPAAPKRGTGHEQRVCVSFCYGQSVAVA